MLHTIEWYTISKTGQNYKNQLALMQSIEKQINTSFPNEINVLVNVTWFGPQFDFPAYQQFVDYYQSNTINNLFFLASEDPIFFNREETQKIIDDSGAKQCYLLGNFDNGPQSFHFYATTTAEYFPKYTEEDLLLKACKYSYLNYNRKPRAHRTKLVNILDERSLTQFGIVTLGNDRTLNETIDIEGNWGMKDDYGIPHDISTLGSLEIWQNHFLNVVSETDFEDHLFTFISEKTWKPIIGLRPFVINGQLDVYRYLREHGFKTFNNYWPHIDLETCNTDDIHKNICSVIQFLQTQDLEKLYIDMLPDLRYNKLRFDEFSLEQKYKMENLFA
jgi:hypothetical protein